MAIADSQSVGHLRPSLYRFSLGVDYPALAAEV
jgi:hypothetical protein